MIRGPPSDIANGTEQTFRPMRVIRLSVPNKFDKMDLLIYSVLCSGPIGFGVDPLHRAVHLQVANYAFQANSCRHMLTPRRLQLYIGAFVRTSGPPSVHRSIKLCDYKQNCSTLTMSVPTAGPQAPMVAEDIKYDSNQIEEANDNDEPIKTEILQHAPLKSAFDGLTIFQTLRVFWKTVLICAMAGFSASTDGELDFPSWRSRIPDG